MTSSIHRMTISELANQGWIIIYDESNGEAVAIRSVIRHWNKLTWAQQTFYRAKYGFDESGVLDISLSERRTPPIDLGFFYSSPAAGEIVVPDTLVPGANDRLRIILAQSRVAIHCSRYDDTPRLNIGPDGTVILTTHAEWGLPRTDSTGYTEPDDAYICYWETDRATWLPTAPWWAMCLD